MGVGSWSMARQPRHCCTDMAVYREVLVPLEPLEALDGFFLPVSAAGSGTNYALAFCPQIKANRNRIILCGARIAAFTEFRIELGLLLPA